MKVKLQEVLEALDGVGMDMEYYYDTKNEEILMIFDGMVNGETDLDLILKRDLLKIISRCHGSMI